MISTLKSAMNKLRILLYDEDYRRECKLSAPVGVQLRSDEPSPLNEPRIFPQPPVQVVGERRGASLPMRRILIFKLLLRLLAL